MFIGKYRIIYRGVYRVVVTSVHEATLVLLRTQDRDVSTIHTAYDFWCFLVLMAVKGGSLFYLLSECLWPPDVLATVFVEVIGDISYGPAHQRFRYMLGIRTQGKQPPCGEITEGQAELEK